MTAKNFHIWNALGRALGQFSDSCYGDSGGPLIKLRNGKAFVVSVVSKGFPGETYSCVPLGTIIATFGSLIKDKMKEHKTPFIE